MADDSTTAAKVRRAYGRGFHDALRRTGEEPVKQARLDEVERSMSGTAKHVLAAVPIEEQWSADKIHRELTRTGRRMQQSVVLGCLRTLKEAGLVREPSMFEFIRVSPKTPALKVVRTEEPQQEPTMPTPASTPQTVTEAPPIETLDKLADAAKQLRALADAAARLAQDVEDVAIEVEQRIERINTESAKLRQLQTLLKELGN